MTYANPAQKLQWQRDWHTRNKVAENERCATWREGNPEKAKASRASWWYTKGQERLAEYARRKREARALRKQQAAVKKASAAALLAKAEELAKKALAERARGYTGNLKPAHF